MNDFIRAIQVDNKKHKIGNNALKAMTKSKYLEDNWFINFLNSMQTEKTFHSFQFFFSEVEALIKDLGKDDLAPNQNRAIKTNVW